MSKGLKREFPSFFTVGSRGTKVDLPFLENALNP